MRKIHFTSLGCARNRVDTEVMMGLLHDEGCAITDAPEEADFLVINTCGFLEAARKESIDTIVELSGIKKKTAKLIVAGCMVQKDLDRLQEALPQVHYFLGSGDTTSILKAIQEDTAGTQVTSAKSYLQQGDVPRMLSTPRHYAYLKIAEGCRKQCSFCIIPKIKGRLRSKTHDQIINEVEQLLEQGVKEIILIAQDLGDYGKDRRERGALESLLSSIMQFDTDFWLRLLYLYPDEITPELIALIKDNPRICPYLDMPIQHINSDILKRMHRKTDGPYIRNTLQTLKQEIPHIVIRTSLIAGFPGETEEEFNELLQFVQEAKLHNIGIFPYSKEPGSFAAQLPNHLPEEVKQERVQRLAAIQQQVVEEHHKALIGQQVQVLVDGYHPDSDLLLQSRFYGQCPEVDGVTILNEWSSIKEAGQFATVQITDAVGYDLVARAL